jgi:GTP-binding protein YchF
MSIDIGIIGLPQSGKTTIFHALTGGKAQTAGHAAEAPNPHIGIARVPEPRLQVLNEMLHPKKLVPVEARYIDIGASVKGLSQDKGFGGELLNQLSNVDMLISVVRAFVNDSLPHPQGSLDTSRDIGTINLELVFSDLAIIERRLEKIENSLKGAKPPERQAFLREKETLARFKTELEKDLPIRKLTLDPSEARMMTNYQFLTAKPLLIIANIGEGQLPQAAALEAELNSRYADEKCRAITLCGQLEVELSQLENGAAQEFRAGFGIKESGLERTIKLSYELSGLISFFTIASNEVRAWSIKKGTTALKAAGKIHSDMEKGFIRAEGISYDDLVRCGSIAEARKQGRLRLEGKDYVIQDGDVITFLFNL